MVAVSANVGHSEARNGIFRRDIVEDCYFDRQSDSCTHIIQMRCPISGLEPFLPSVDQKHGSNKPDTAVCVVTTIPAVPSNHIRLVNGREPDTYLSILV